MDKKTSKVIQQIRKVAAETGLQGKYKALSEELNKRGITSSRGAKWRPQGLANICNRHDLFKGEEESLPVAPTTQPPTPVKQAKPEEYVSTPHAKLLEPESLQLDVDTIAVLREVTEWWKSGGAAMVMRNITWEEETAEPAYRPNFPGKKKNTGLRVNERLLEAALAKAKSPAESVKTSGGLSPLIERLFWQYLGFDRKYLSKPDA